MYLTDQQLAEKVRPNLITTLVVPCYNEAERLDIMAFLTALDQNPLLRFVFVNDGSQDATLARLTSLQGLRPEKIEVLDLAQNSGKAEAVRQGLIRALDAEGVDPQNHMVGYWDADLATPLYAVDDLLRVAKRLPDLQVIFGSRRNMIGHKIDRTLTRRLVSKLCSSMASMAVRLPLGDTQCGAKLLRATPEVRAALSKPFTASWLFDVELFTRIAGQLETPAKAFFEYPLTQWDEIPGSKVTTRAIARAGLVMVRLIAGARMRQLSRLVRGKSLSVL